MASQYVADLENLTQLKRRTRSARRTRGVDRHRLVFQTEHGNDDNKISSFSIKRCRTRTRKLSSRRIGGNIVPSKEFHYPKGVHIPSYLSITRGKSYILCDKYIDLSIAIFSFKTSIKSAPIYRNDYKMNKIQNIIEEIKKLEKELLLEVEKKEEEFFYRIKGRKIYFEEEAKKYQRKFHVKLSSYLIQASLFNLMTFPIIWICLIPAVFLDVSVTFYQMICFPIYGMPKVKRSEYIVIDRHSLQYLNIIEKLNCSYCGYFNGLIAYIQEIAARTEQYWCPIKHARKLAAIHSRYHKFLEYGDCKDYQDKLATLRKDFTDLQ